MTKNTRPPEQAMNEKDTWVKPDMTLVDDCKPAAPKFPDEVMGEWVAWLKDAAASKSAPPDFVLLALLTTVSALLANVRQGSPWKGWTEPTILWGALVGLPSSSKSPALDVVRDALRPIEEEMAQDYEKVVAEYERAKAMAQMHKLNWQTACKKVKDGNLPPPPEQATDPDLPPRPRIAISDITIESAAEIATHNPRGLLLVRDELAGLLTNFERHGGSDREFYLEAYGGRSYTVDRKKHPEPYIIKRLSVAILGTIQPEKLARVLVNTEEDGFAARFLFVWPEAVKFEKPKVVHDSAKLLCAFERLRELPLDEDDAPKVLPFSKEAQHVFVEWRKRVQRSEQRATGTMISFIGKMPGVAVRLSVVLTYLDWSALKNASEPKGINLQYLERAIALIDDYLIPMAKRAFADIALPQAQADARTVAQWILRTEPHSINLRLMRRKGRVLDTPDAERYAAAIKHLLDCGWVRHAQARNGKQPGRLQGTYRVNPHLFD